MDAPKRLVNLEAHQLDFTMIEDAIFDTAIIVPGKKGRYVALNRIDDRPYAVVFRRLGSQGVSLISLRVASVKERRSL